MQSKNFPKLFKELTGTWPFPWQEVLFANFIEGKIPESANIPTGLGKTSIVAIWLCALALAPGKTSRRLVYAVNRRTVVDQTTAEAERLREALKKPELAEVRNALADLCALPLPTPDAPPVAISTLRGQFADNGEWCADPSRPAIIIGTVDMIGSGLLFSRYTRGFKTRPLYAGFLGQDALLVHDEAHLEPAFQKLMESIVTAQAASNDSRKLRVIELTATSRAANTNNAPAFTLTDQDLENEVVMKRYNAVKRLSFAALADGEKVEAKLAALAEKNSSERAVLIFTRSVQTAVKVAAELSKGGRKGKVATLTGTMRGKERDDLVTSNAVFQRFLPPSSRSKEVTPAEGTVYLIATSAGEVGVNLSADNLVCDLSTYESMAQRFGRVNRFGDTLDCTITVVHETKFDIENKKTGALEAARERTLEVLEKLPDSASPAALDKLDSAERAAAFSPEPEQRVATEIQFDAWALTSIREPIAARPPVAPYLHGEAEWQPSETYLAWRDDRDFRHIEDPEAFLDSFPLKPAELLRDKTARIAATLAKLLDSRDDLPDGWLIAENGSVSRFPLSNFDKDAAESSLADATLILPASVGGLDANGLFSGNGDIPASDVSFIIRHETANRDEVPAGGAKIVCFAEISDEDAEEPSFLLWCEPVTKNAIGKITARSKPQREILATHTAAVAAHAAAIAAKVFTGVPAAGEPDLGRCLVVAAGLHDLGKNRAQWQRNIGNLAYDPAKPDSILAKSAPGMRPRNVAEHYRHEFGSLNDAHANVEFSKLNDTERDIVLHLVAAHHGRARPHFPADEIFDFSGNVTLPDIGIEIPRRFARMQKRFGRWGLAWLESLLRAADYAASAGIVATNQSDPAASRPTAASSQARQSRNMSEPAPTATLAVNPANPGHYFACCGLFEHAARLSPDALAWFEQDSVSRQWRFHLVNTPPLPDILEKITASEIIALDLEDATASPIFIDDPFKLRVDWWKTSGTDTSALKVWAGTMEAPRIARAMQKAISNQDGEKILFDLRIAYAPEDVTKKVEPFYFDAIRGPNSDARDVGFSANDLGLETLAAPAVEFFTLVGLQRAIPQPSGDRIFDYHLWQKPVPIALLAAAINGFAEPADSQQSFRFESWYRTSQRKHKAFLPAKSL